MGNDGGSIPDRRDLVRSKPKAEQADKANQTKARWFFCALSKRKLQEPVVSCALGKLYNKDAIIEYLLNKQAYGDGEKICGHIRSLKDVKTLKLTPNPAASPDSKANDGDAPEAAPFVCSLTLKEMNGVQPFVYISTCGCVFSQAGLRTISQSTTKENGNGKGKAKEGDKESPPEDEAEESLNLCPQCQTKYHPKEDVITINPSEEDEMRMRFAMERRRIQEAASKKKSKKRKNADATESPPSDEKAKRSAPQPSTDSEPPTKKRHTSSTPAPHPPSSTSTPRTGTPQPNTHRDLAGPHLNPTIAGASRAVVEELAKEEAKRKAKMSPALKSLYGDGKPKKKETFMTMGTFTRYA